MANNEYMIYSVVFGEYKVGEYLYELLKQPVIQELKNISQLSLSYKNPKFYGSDYPRLAHINDSVIATKKLLEVLKKKYKDRISRRDELIVCTAIAVHDGGQIAFSHLGERSTGINHEELTYERIIKRLQNFINSNIDKNATNDVLNLLRNNEEIKSGDGKNYAEKYTALFSENMFRFAMSSLLVGGFDTDRVAYIMHDLKVMFGLERDFTNIYNDILFEVVKGYPQVVFRENAIKDLEEFFRTRFYLYKDGYFDTITLLNEENYLRAMKILYPNPESQIELSQIEIIYQMTKIYKENSKRVKVWRYSSNVLNGIDENILYKRFENDEKAAMYFWNKLCMYIDNKDSDSVGWIKRKATMYDPEKNVIYIKRNDGSVRPIEDVSLFINSKISVNISVIYVDIWLLTKILEEKGYKKEYIDNLITNLNELFNANKYELEKKRICTEDVLTAVGQYIFQKFSVEGISRINNDQYFITKTPNDEITARFREDTGYVIKSPEDPEDLRSITKRGEENLGFIDEQKYLKCLQESLILFGFEPIQSLEKDIQINTKRIKYLIEYNGAKIELALDRSTYSNGIKTAEDFMIEAELKEGEGIGLISFILLLDKKFPLSVCEESKVKRGRRMLK